MRIIILMLLSIIPFVSFSQSWKDSKVSWKDSKKEYNLKYGETGWDPELKIYTLKETSTPLEGLVKVKYDNGNYLLKHVFINGKPSDGFLKSYYDNGKLLYKAFFKNGLEEGVVQTFHPNGKVAYEVNYMEGVIQGEIKQYDSNGDLIKK